MLVDNPAQVLCHVCLSGAETVDNQIVLCGDGATTGCDTAVHQKCYGVDAVPEGDWLCDPCTHWYNNGGPAGERRPLVRYFLPPVVWVPHAGATGAVLPTCASVSTTPDVGRGTGCGTQNQGERV